MQSGEHHVTGDSVVDFHVLAVPANSLLIHLSGIIKAIANMGEASPLSQAIGTEEVLSCVTDLISHGPLTLSQFMEGHEGQRQEAAATSYDLPFPLYLPSHWLWDLSGVQEELCPESVVPRARLVEALGAIAAGKGPGAVLVTSKASKLLVNLLTIDLDDEVLRSWEAVRDPDERFLQDQLVVSLLQLLTAGQNKFLFGAFRASLNGSCWLISPSSVAKTPGGRVKLMEAAASSIGQVWTPPASFKQWDLGEDQPQALDGLWPYLRYADHRKLIDWCQSSRLTVTMPCYIPSGCYRESWLKLVMVPLWLRWSIQPFRLYLPVAVRSPWRMGCR